MTSAPRTRLLTSVFLMLGATASFVAMQALVKSGRQAGLDASEVMFFRTAPGLPVLWWTLTRNAQGLRANRPLDLLVRSLLGSCAMGTNFTAMLWLSLAQFSTLGLLQPVFVALAAPLLLREHVAHTTWLALGLAALGAYVLIAPGFSELGLPWLGAGLGTASALFSAFAHISVRRATAHDPPERVVFYFAAFVAIASLMVGLARGRFLALPAGLGPERFIELACGLAFTGTLGQVLMTRAYVHGEAALVALVGYSSVPLSILADVAFFAAPPPPSAMAGAALMLGAGWLLARASTASALGSHRR